MDASKSFASHPNDDRYKEASYNAMQDVKTNTAQSVNFVKTTFFMRELEKEARSAVKAANKCIATADEHFPDDEDLQKKKEQCQAVAIVLEEKLDEFAENPDSAKLQTQLLIAAKRFLEPTIRLETF